MMDSPIVTIVWRMSSPCMNRNTHICSTRPNSAALANPAATAKSHEPVFSPAR